MDRLGFGLVFRCVCGRPTLTATLALQRVVDDLTTTDDAAHDAARRRVSMSPHSIEIEDCSWRLYQREIYSLAKQ
jgi:hypothetical protein